MRPVFYLCLGLLFLSNSGVWGEDAETAAGAGKKPAQIVVTGAKVAEDVEEAVEKVEVITAEEIAQKGAKTAAEALEQIPGLVIYEHPQSTVMMQGFDGAYVKVLVNGLEVAGDIGGATELSLIPLSDVERIEIVRGASSALYGSDALGGVINIITKKPEASGKEGGEFNFKTTQELGSNLRYYGDLAAGYQARRFALSGRGSFDYDNGKQKEIKKGGKKFKVNEMAEARLASARGDVSIFLAEGRLDLYGGWTDSRLAVSADEENGYDFLNTRAEGGATLDYALGDALSLAAFFKYDRLDYDATRHSYVWESDSPYAASLFQNFEGEGRLAWEPSISHALLAGFNVRRESLDSDAFADEKAAANVSVFAQDLWNIGGLDQYRLTPGVRCDFYLPQGSGEKLMVQGTPKLGFRWDPAAAWTLRASYGMGFKAPSLKEKYWVFFHPTPYNFLIKGNPDLKPETSHGVNLRAEYRPRKDLRFEAGVYYNYLFNMIDARQVPGSGEGEAVGADGVTHAYIYIMRYANTGKAQTAGGDAAVRYTNARFSASLSGAYSLAKGWDDDAGAWLDLESRPPFQAAVSLSYRVPVIETDVGLRLNWTAPAWESVSEKTKSPDYLMAALRLSRRFFKEKLEVYGGVKNLLNNLHFVKGSAGQNQLDYYGLRDGMIFYLGGIFKW